MRSTMWKLYQTGQITQQKWLVFCNWYMWEIVMKNPEVVEIMVRMKNGPN